MTQRMASVPDQSFPEPWQPIIGAPVTVYTGGDAHQWRVSHIKQGIGASITITHELIEMIVDKSWFMSKKTRVVSQILRSTRKIWKNELIAVFGLTSAITKTDEFLEL